MFCPLNDFDTLKLNRNTGIEYEFGVGMALMIKSQYDDFLKYIVQDHPKKNKVIEVYNITKNILSKELKYLGEKNNRYISFAPTQNDSLGPSDILVCNNKEILFGISIKFANSNNWNPSAKNFLDSDIIKKLKLIYVKDYLPKYKNDMKSRFGECKLIRGSRNTWSRKRSSVTDDFIDLIRDEFITSWENKDLSERKLILNKGFHVNSPLKYYVIEIGSKDWKLSDPKPISEIQDIYLEKYKTSYVAFKVGNKILVKLQIKFNNGFIEKTESSQNNKFKIDDIYFKNGDPFGSWNFNIF